MPDIQPIKRAAFQAASFPIDQLAEAWKGALDALRDAVLITDTQGRIVYANPRCEEVSGYSLAEMRGQRPSLFRSGRVVDWTYDNLWKTITAGDTWQGIFVNRKKSGEEFVEYAKISPIRSASGEIIGYVDLKTLVRYQDGIYDERSSILGLDSVTELPNRDFTKKALADRLQVSAINQRQSDFWFLIVDIDRFHDLNATLGAQAGDALLAAYARRLRNFFGRKGFVGRLGSDEFAVIIDEAGLPRSVLRRDTLDRMEALQQCLGASLPLGSTRTAASASIGVTKAPLHHDDNVSSILDRANHGLKRAKKNSQRFFTILTSGRRLARDGHQSLQEELLAAIEQQAITLHVQPVFDQTGLLVGAESLARWTRADGTPVAPPRFLDAARQLGKMKELTVSLIGQLIAFQQRLFASGHAIPVSLNLEAAEYLSAEVYQSLTDGIARADLPPRLFKIELTETSIMHDSDAVTRRMQALRGFGIRHSLDDFGTGYSSLTHLADLPIDEVKIDRSFVGRLPFHRPSCCICKSVCSIAEGLHIDVVAEGVERSEHAEFFQPWPTTHLQGYLFGRPVAMDLWPGKWP
ncbi:MAG: EAL domain-containing protein [Wenzhouxiangella sp.]